MYGDRSRKSTRSMEKIPVLARTGEAGRRGHLPSSLAAGRARRAGRIADSGAEPLLPARPTAQFEVIVTCPGSSGIGAHPLSCTRTHTPMTSPVPADQAWADLAAASASLTTTD
jgi:hypothetical protein